jgi:hypothetical protein
VELVFLRARLEVVQVSPAGTEAQPPGTFQQRIVAWPPSGLLPSASSLLMVFEPFLQVVLLGGETGEQTEVEPVVALVLAKS